jgi:hypothetical protein
MKLELQTINWVIEVLFIITPKAKAIIAGILTENPAIQFFFIHFFVDNSNANISLYTLSCPKLKFRYILSLL